MFFSGEDPVAIHTLAMAGFQILRDLAGDRAEQDPRVQQWVIDSRIKPGKKREFWEATNKFSSFLKHADRDPGGIYDKFEEEGNDWVLYFASEYFCTPLPRWTP